MKTKTLVFMILSGSFLCGQLQWQEGGIPVNHDYPLYWYSNSGLVIGDNSYFLWSDSQSGSADLYLQGYDSAGNPIWDNHLLICDAPGYQGRGQIIAGDNASLLVVWKDTRDIPGISYGSGYHLYAQKVSANGELMWGDNGVFVGLNSNAPDGCRVITDGTGGVYISSFQGNYYTTWHINSLGEHYPGWENGVPLEVQPAYSFNILADVSGNLIIFYSTIDEINLSRAVIRKLSITGDIIWDDLIVSDQLIHQQTMFLQNDVLDIAFNSHNTLYFQQIDENGLLVNNEPLIIYESQSAIIDFSASTAESAYYFSIDDYYLGSYLLKTDPAGNEIWSIAPDISGTIDGIHAMSNGNLRVWQAEYTSFTLWEYDPQAILVSPAGGWWHCEYPEPQANYLFGVFSDADHTAIAWRNITDSYENVILTFQLLSESGTAVCGQDGSAVSSGRSYDQHCKGIYKIGDYEIVLLMFYSSGNWELIMKIFDEEGNEVSDPQGISISNPDMEYAEPLGVYQNRLYYVMEIEEQQSCPLLYLNAIEFNEQPEQVWGETGLFLGEGEFINSTINMTTIPEQDNTLLFSWNVSSPNGYTRVQKLVNDQFVWQDGGVIFPSLIGNTHRVVAYNDYLMQMYSWGNGYYLNRVDQSGGSAWDNDLLIASNNIYDIPRGIPLPDGNMLFLMGEYINNGFCLKEHVITPQGEDLSGEQGHAINFLNEAVSLRFIDCQDSYAVITQKQNDDIELRRYLYDSTPLADPLTIAGYDLSDITALEIIDDHLFIFTNQLMGGQQLCLIDFQGQLSGLLPSNPYSIIESANYPNTPFTIKDDHDLYFCWLDGYASERPDEGEYAWNWFMQKFSLPSNHSSPDNICPAVRLDLFPNPFNPNLNISWENATMTNNKAEIAVYNLKGQLINKWDVSADNGKIIWEGTNQSGNHCASGLYLIKFKTGGISSAFKAVLLK
jgi:hypothetical protein